MGKYPLATLWFLISLALGTLRAQEAENLDVFSSLLQEEAALTAEAEVVVTAARYAQRVDRTPSNVFLFTRKQLDALGPKSLADVLRYVPGFTVTRRQQLGHELSAFGVGGQFSNKILVLLDGHRLTEPSLGAAPWQDFPVILEEVERIEVVLGPESTLYGSNAFAGVVNVITGAHLGKEVERLGVRAGNRGFSDFSYHRSTRLDSGNLSLSLLEENRGSFGPLVDGAGRPDPFFTSGEEIGRRVVRVVHEGRPAQGWTSRTSLAFSEVDQKYLPLAPGAQRELDGTSRNTWISWDLDRNLGGDRNLSLRTGFYEFDRTLSQSPFALFGVMGTHQDSSQLDLELTLSDRVGPWRVASGASARHVTASSYLLQGDDDARTTELFVHGERDFGERFVLFLGARKVFQELADDEVSWKLAGLYRPRPDTAVRLSLGTSFRQPDLASARFLTTSSFRGAPTNQPIFQSNPSLSNEVAKGFLQLGLERRWEDVRAKVDFYTADLEGLIDLVPVGPPLMVLTPAPVALPIRSQQWRNSPTSAEVRGVTVALEKNLGIFRLTLGGNRQHVEAANGVDLAPYAPRFSQTLVLSLPSEGRRWSGSLSWLRISSVDVDDNARLDGASPQLPGYHTFDLHLDRRLSDRTSLGLSVRNLLDKQVREMVYSLVGDHQEQGVRFGREVWMSLKVDL